MVLTTHLHWSLMYLIQLPYTSFPPTSLYVRHAHPLPCSHNPVPSPPYMHPRHILASTTAHCPASTSVYTMGSMYYTGCEEFHHQPHFLEACFLCKKPLGHNNDIFMYRGNTPFCSQECRQEHIEIEEDKERRRKRSKRAALRQATEPPNNGGHNKTVQTDTLAVSYH